MTRYWAVTALLVATRICTTTWAYAPKTEKEKEENGFYSCINALEEADIDHNDRLSEIEYQPFIQDLAETLFGDDTFVLDENNDLPQEVTRLYAPLIGISGAQDGSKTIDIFGASLKEIAGISQDRSDKLRAVCEMVMKELAKLGPQTKGLSALEAKKSELFEEEEEEEDGEEEEYQTEMIGVNHSFVLYNKSNITKDQLDLSEGGTLYEVYLDFLDELMDASCPTGAPCTEEPQDEGQESDTDGSTRARYLLSRRLCHGTDRMRRMLCGGMDNDDRRRLSAGGIFQDAILYEVKDTDCPEVNHENEQGALLLMRCHTVFAHYDILVSKTSDFEFQDIQASYAAATNHAIANGMLQESLEKMDADSPFTVIGPGEYINT